MARYNDNAPIGNTCPMIDEVIAFIEHLRFEHSNDDNSKDFKDALGLMEDIRKANKSLRDWGNEEYKRAEDAEDDCGRAKKEVSQLEDEVADMQKEIDSLKDEVRSVAV